MSELAKAYSPREHEPRVNELWDKSGYFNPDNLDVAADAQSYTIILPPPNVTDRLHLGHASMLALSDLMIRFKRMNGFRTLWLPGTDHAAIATQTVVERQLLKEEKKTRHDIGREEFLKRVNEFALITQTTILEQIKSFGASLDWSRLAFTLDDQRQAAVKQMFVDMYEAGAIYRGERIVNWCPRCQSTLADDEVEHKAEKAILYTFKYSSDFPFAISTTRPETKLGDTGVAVNPSDERYKQYIGKTFSVDFCGQPLELKVIADREVESDFGTGALGVTPAHSMIDWRMAEQHDLKIVKVINEQGTIHEGFGEYSNKTALDARELIVANLRGRGLIEKEEEIEHNVSVCYRCGTVIEPLPSLQWFISVSKPLERLGGKSLKEVALAAAEQGDITFLPERFNKRYTDWMKNLRDWCISRQIWFGHRIPVWYRPAPEASDGKSEEIYVGLTAPEGSGWRQDQDTLDTWFSSGMWTFSTLGWPSSAKATEGKPEKSGDLKKFHPTDVLETGYEIITLWVSRMIMMSFFALGEIPFKTVYLHGMVLDKAGKKMSKSKGNGIDPVVVGEEYGTDAVRLALLLGNTAGVDVRVSEEKIESNRNFINKLWNISRYILSQEVTKGEAEMTVADKWIMSRLSVVTTNVTKKIEDYDFSGAGEELRSFTLDDLADWYLEASKFEPSPLKPRLLREILETILKLWHPFIPFITETIWGHLGKDKLLLISTWPEAGKTEIEADFDMIRAVVVTIRNMRSEHKIVPSQKIKTVIFAHGNTALFDQSKHLITSLRTGIGELEINENGTPLENALYASVQGIDIYLEVEVDTIAKKEGLTKEIENLKRIIAITEAKLSNEEFTGKAPQRIVEGETKKLSDYKTTLEKVSTQLEKL